MVALARCTDSRGPGYVDIGASLSLSARERCEAGANEYRHVLKQYPSEPRLAPVESPPRKREPPDVLELQRELQRLHEELAEAQKGYGAHQIEQRWELEALQRQTEAGLQAAHARHLEQRLEQLRTEVAEREASVRLHGSRLVQASAALLSLADHAVQTQSRSCSPTPQPSRGASRSATPAPVQEPESKAKTASRRKQPGWKKKGGSPEPAEIDARLARIAAPTEPRPEYTYTRLRIEPVEASEVASASPLSLGGSPLKLGSSRRGSRQSSPHAVVHKHGHRHQHRPRSRPRQKSPEELEAVEQAKRDQAAAETLRVKRELYAMMHDGEEMPDEEQPSLPSSPAKQPAAPAPRPPPSNHDARLAAAFEQRAPEPEEEPEWSGDEDEDEVPALNKDGSRMDAGWEKNMMGQVPGTREFVAAQKDKGMTAAERQKLLKLGAKPPPAVEKKKRRRPKGLGAPLPALGKPLKRASELPPNVRPRSAQGRLWPFTPPPEPTHDASGRPMPAEPKARRRRHSVGMPQLTGSDWLPKKKVEDDDWTAKLLLEDLEQFGEALTIALRAHNQLVVEVDVDEEQPPPLPIETLVLQEYFYQCERVGVRPNSGVAKVLRQREQEALLRRDEALEPLVEAQYDFALLRVGNRGVRPLLVALGRDRDRPVKVSLRDCALSMPGGRMLATFVSKHPTLVSLDARHNAFAFTVGHALCTGLHERPSESKGFLPVDIDLRDTRLSQTGLQAGPPCGHRRVGRFGFAGKRYMSMAQALQRVLAVPE